MLGRQRPRNWKICVIPQIHCTYFRVRYNVLEESFIIKKRQKIMRVLETRKKTMLLCL